MRSIPAGLSFLALVACNGSDKSDTDTTTSNPNQAPVADAGTDQTATTDGESALDGSGSYDPDGDSISYHWSFDRVPDGSTLLDKEAPFKSNHTSSAASAFTPDTTGVYIVGLMVEDQKGMKSETDYVIVTVEAGSLPIANAGADQAGLADSTFNLDGTASFDPLGRDLTYTWSFAQTPDGSAASISNADTAKSSFVADLQGAYIISLVVHNGIADSVPDTSLVSVAIEGGPPQAVAGDDIDTEDCTAIPLDGSGSWDPDGESLTYRWALQKAPTNSSATDANFSDVAEAKPTFWADAAGSYSVTLSVYDGTNWSTPDVITLNVAERSYNSAPVVDAGSALVEDAGSATCTEDGYTYDCDDCSALTVDLGADATATDADGDPLVYYWEVLSGDATISDTASLATTTKLTGAAPTEPGVATTTDYSFQLTVTDCTGASVTDTVTITASCTGVEDTGTTAKKK